MSNIEKARLARWRNRQPPTELKTAERAEALHTAARRLLLKEAET